MEKFVIANGTLLKFNGGGDTSCIVPAEVHTIACHAFYLNKRLTRVYIPKSVTDIHEDAFSCCPALTIYCEGEPCEGWVDRVDKEERSYYSAEDDAFNFHRSSGGWTSHSVIEEIERRWNPQNRPVITNVSLSEFEKE
ncbi:MAG: leucine-rich repeat domain-containing protein [Roseburia sp.]|nr:leucine-rich repeat domain-containing protein [Roseburia sp.]